MKSVDPTDKNVYQARGQSHDQYIQKCPDNKCITVDGMYGRQF